MLMPADLEAVDRRRFARKKDALDVARDLQVVIEPLLFVRFRIDDRVVEREGRLLGDRFEDDEIARRKGGARRAVGQREHAHVLLPVKQRRYHDGSGTEGGPAQICQLRHVFEIGEVDGLAAFPGTAEQAFAGIDGVRAEITVKCDGRGGSLLQDAVGHFDERRTTLGKECRLQARPGAIHHVKRATVRIENAGRAFDDQAMQIMRPDDIAKGFAEAVEEIEDEIFLDLDFLVRAFELADAPALPLISQQPADERSDEQPEKKNAHGSEARLLRRAFVLEVLFEVFEDVLEAGNIFRCRLAERLVCLEHCSHLLALRGRRLFGRVAIGLRERLALRGLGPVDLDVEDLVESQTGQQFAASFAAMNHMKEPSPSSFKRSATPAIVPMNVESIMTHFSRSKTNSR